MTRLSVTPSSHARFGDFDADFKTGELTRRGEPIRLQDLPFRMLQALIERPGELVTRAELRERLWGADTFVDYEAGLNTAVAKLRDALDDRAERPQFIETIPKRGYRFIGQSEWVSPQPAQPAAPAASAGVPPSTPARLRRSRPPAVLMAGFLIVVAVAGYATWRVRTAASATRIAVVLFDNETGQPGFDRLAQQLTDATVFALTARPDLAVIGNAAVLRTARPFRDIAAIRDALHADFIVIGQIQMQDAAAIVRTHLIRAADQAHVWVGVTPLAAGGESALTKEVASRVERGVATHVPSRR
jgi:DNA-binding winged helix-turn-helix (wHTH) protein/TolB-like protein